ncbi:unnamed protein product [Leptosia nina]|uniref:Serpin domain-containing protein n=1 Tax=Leptosia nina TaxID=320188 RepID=A0AAV1JFD2_9NEOP
MKIQLFYMISFCSIVFGKHFYCNKDSAIASFKRPTYDFSVRILDRVSQQTDGHFVFSPISTWLQLITLAEGAIGPTAEEIWNVTRYHRVRCFRRKFREVLNIMNEDFSPMTKRSSTFVINKLVDVKKTFADEAMKSRDTTIVSVDFDDPVAAAEKVNEIINRNTDGVIDEGFYEDDFDLTILLMTDTAYFRGDWQSPFNPAYTSNEPFHSETNQRIGEVRLMSQIGYFNVTDVPTINATVLELPFGPDGRMSMLVVLPKRGSVEDLYFNLHDIRLMTIYSLFRLNGPKLVSVRLPRFKVRTELENIPELVYDMGVKRIFYPHLADLSGISEHLTHASLMTQIADIEITERGANATAAPEFLISDSAANEEFVANRPFAHLIVDKKTDIILFAGIYSNPSIY